MRYRIKALDAAGALAELTVEAESVPAARRQARERGLTVVELRRTARLPWTPGAGLNRFSHVHFAQQLVALLDAGLGLVEALEALSLEPRTDGDGVVRRLLERVRSGTALSAAMQAQPGAFPPLLAATARASERTGDLKEALQRYADYAVRVDALRRKVVNACIYPALLMATGVLVLAFLMFYVVPRFSRLYEEIGGDLPWTSRWLVQWGALLENHMPALWAIGLVLVVLLSWGARRRWLQEWLRGRLVSVPRIAEAARVYQLARLYRTLGMLLKSGTPVVAALDMVPGLLDPALRSALLATRRAVAQGRPLAASLTEHGLTTPVAHGLLRVGERGGQLADMMDRVANHYDDSLASWVDVASRLIEPLLMIAIGLLVGAVVVMLYLPVFELANSIR